MNTKAKEKRKFTLKHDAAFWMYLFQILIMASICFVHSIGAGHYMDFFPINGTFQNFNPVRRFLAGQVPYRDFGDYLGLGHLYIGTICTFFYGGDYHASLQAFSFLQFVGLAGCIYVIGKFVLGKKDLAAALTNIVLICVLVQPSFFKNALVGTDEIYESMTSALGPGNSARFLRGLILPLVAVLMTKCISLFTQYSNILNKNRFVAVCVPYIVFGIIAGGAFIWSTDYGIGCWLCIAIISFWEYFCANRKILLAIAITFVEIITSIITIISLVEVFTLGHLKQWLGNTLATGGYQSWYYISPKSFYFFDVDFSFAMCVQAGLVIFYLIKLFLTHGSWEAFRRFGILGFANMVCFCVANEYKLLSGGIEREVAHSILFATILFEIIGLFRKYDNINNIKYVIIYVAFITSISWIVETARDEIVFAYFTDKNGTYIEELGGYIQTYGEDLLKADKFLKGASVWATYSSAQEVVSGIYQPSGTDYIIHVLGDKQRNDYLNKFQTGDFDYTATIKEQVSDLEYWIERANWFFYRELYKDWHPVFGNSYELYWTRNTSEDENVIKDGIELSVQDIDESTKKIIVNCNHEVDGIADVCIDYAVSKKTNFSSKFVFKKMLCVENTGNIYAETGIGCESNVLRDISIEYIPVRIVNGYGEVTISARPSQSVALNLNNCYCNEILTVASKYVELNSVLDDKNAVNVRYCARNADALDRVKSIGIQDKYYDVINSEVTEEFITLYLDREVDYSKKKTNQIEIIN